MNTKATEPTETSKLSFLTRANVAYGIVGLILILQFTTHHSVHGAYRSFLAGWFVSVVNFELLKRLLSLVVPLYKENPQTPVAKVNPFIYALLVGKVAFWGLVIAGLMIYDSIQAIPFVFGVLTILVAGIGLAMREMIYARA